MSRKLHAEDARVVDMLLNSDHFATDASVPQNFSQSDMLNNRFIKVEKLLKVLDQMPAMDPPANLVARTMNFIDQAVQHRHAPVAGEIAQQRPTA